MTAKVTERVDALNGESGQVLHLRIFPSVALRGKNRASAKKPTNVARLLRRGHCGVKGKWHKM
jgi:hypothetical protein